MLYGTKLCLYIFSTIICLILVNSSKTLRLLCTIKMTIIWKEKVEEMIWILDIHYWYSVATSRFTIKSLFLLYFSKWEIILCEFCGSHGAHVACNHLEKLGKHDICKGCKDVDEKSKCCILEVNVTFFLYNSEPLRQISNSH
jgi:hypothetical protein